MTCTICKEFDHSSGRNRNVFIEGSNNFRTSAIKDHEKYQAHLRACSSKSASEKPDSTPLMKGLAKMSEHKRQTMLKLFTIVLYMAINNKPYTDFCCICKVLILGLI